MAYRVYQGDRLGEVGLNNIKFLQLANSVTSIRTDGAPGTMEMLCRLFAPSSSNNVRAQNAYLHLAQGGGNSLLFPTGRSLGSGCPDPDLAYIQGEEVLQTLDLVAKRELGIDLGVKFSIVDLQSVLVFNFVFCGSLKKRVDIPRLTKDRGGRVRTKPTFVGPGIPFPCPSDPYRQRCTFTVFANGKFNATGLKEGENDVFIVLQQFNKFIEPYLTDVDADSHAAIEEHIQALEYEVYLKAAEKKKKKRKKKLKRLGKTSKGSS